MIIRYGSDENGFDDAKYFYTSDSIQVLLERSDDGENDLVALNIILEGDEVVIRFDDFFDTVLSVTPWETPEVVMRPRFPRGER